MKNWKTTIAGICAGLPTIIEGIMLRNPVLITTGIGTILMGLFAKDNNVTGV